MGQKVNPTVLRLGSVKNWKIKHSEKSHEEFQDYSFKDKEMRDYLVRVLELAGFSVHDYRVCYSGEEVDVFVSCFLLQKKPRHGCAAVTWLKYKKRGGTELFPLTTSEPLDTTKLSAAKPNLWGLISKSIKDYLKTPKKVNFYVLFFNKHLRFAKRERDQLKKTALRLQRFKKSKIFARGLSLLGAFTKSGSFCEPLAKFISLFLGKAGKKQGRVLGFLKRFLKFLKTKLRSFSGVKVHIRGRINGRPRARKLKFKIGDVPIHSFKHGLDYAESHTQNKNGSYGVKVWVSYKNNLQQGR